MRTRATITMAVFAFVLGFVLTLTIMGFSPWEAVGVALAAGTVTGTITRLLLDLLSAFGPTRADRPIDRSTPPPANEVQAGSEPDAVVPAPTEEFS